MHLDEETFGLLIDSVRRFVDTRLIPNEHLLAELDEVPADILTEMRELGLFGLSIKEEHGGLGLDMEEEVRVVFQLGRTSPAFRSAFGTNVGIGSQAIVMAGSEEQKQRYLTRMANGEIVGSFALTEPEAGSDALSIKTRAVRDGDHYVLNGTKRYITNAPVAGLFSVMARTGDGRSARDISCFLVEAGTPGLTLGRPDKKMGQQGAKTCDVIFENCRVPASQLLGGEEGTGFTTAMRVLDKGRLHISAMAVGAATRLIEDSVRYAKERKQFGQPIAEFQLVQAMIADSQAETYAARSMVLDAARRRDRGENATLTSACCKLFATEMVGRVADRAVQIHGGAGYMAEYGIERFYRDVRLFRIYEGTSQIQQLVIARETVKAADSGRTVIGA
ncbi:MAG: acyl-CoA dehydrogenase family protein [Gammaproteobacteria bacterium]|nr:acyl-CoA dehydrogenase family protein [Gammaproteobacteria bacterium]